MSTFITESWLRERHGLSEGTELRLPADARLTPAARALIDERHLSLKFHDEQGRLYRATEEPDADGAPCLQAVHGLTGSARRVAATCQLCGSAPADMKISSCGRDLARSATAHTLVRCTSFAPGFSA